MRPFARARARACAMGVAVVASAATSLQAQTPPTLEQLLKAPFASDLVAGPTGNIAWVEIVLGARNIWIAEPPAYRERQITRYSQDDGMRMTQLAFTADGRGILFVRGGNQRGTRLPDPPNPQLLTQGVREEVWFVSTDGSVPSRVDEGVAPVVSPRGDVVVYLKDNQIWGASLSRSGTTTGVGQPTQLVRDRGPSSAVRWSPKGDKLAFVSARDEHSFIGVYDVDARSLSFLDPSTDRDGEPTWSPDGTRIAFLRIPSAPGERSAGARREARPWSIRVADVGSGRGRDVWRANQGMGSAFWTFLGNDRQLFWGADDRIVFPWERTGWLHMYSVPASGGDATALTSGDFEVEHVTLSQSGRELVFSSNQGDIDRRHLWRVSVSRGPARPVTTGTGNEYWPVITSNDSVLAFHSTGIRVPPRVEIARMRDLAAGPATPATRRALAANIAPPDFPAAALVDQQQVIFPATDGLQLHGQLFLPSNYKAGERYPAIVYYHGGSRSQQLLGYNYIQVDYYQKHYALNQYLANHGYIVLSVNYRSGTGYGMQFREAEGYGSSGGTEIRDAIGAAQFLRGRPDVDAKRIGAWGGSYGGYLTAIALARASELYAAGVDFHGVHSYDNIRFSPFTRMDSAQQRQVRLTARTSSPLGNVDTWRSPVLLIHGDDDRNVPFTQTVILSAALRQRGVDVEELVIPNDEHSFLLHSNWLMAFTAAAEYFDRKLKSTP